MTPKEKALELISKMEKDFQYFASKQIAIQHALIAVDEIQGIKSVYHDEELYDYYEQVKHELNKQQE